MVVIYTMLPNTINLPEFVLCNNVDFYVGCLPLLRFCLEGFSKNGYAISQKKRLGKKDIVLPMLMNWL